MTAIVDSAQVTGTGPVRVIALHGWFGSAATWKPWVDLFDPARFSIACFDYRGYGARITEAGDHTLEEIAADTLQLADELGWQRFHLVGHSMGGKAILRVLATAPDRVGGLLGITPVPACPIPFDEPTWALFSSAATDIDARKAIIDHSTGNRLPKRWIAAAAASSWGHATPAAFGAYLNAWAKTDFVADVSGLHVPMHVVVGEHDPSLTADLMRATTLAWLPRATLQVMANAGHYPTDEAPLAMAACFENAFPVPA